ncbi:MAG: peptidase T [Methanocella sp. PtaU1.Bin125]|nr:MAG: peptidase T [Methanocella sp. PtaU1.Bin125]
MFDETYAFTCVDRFLRYVKYDTQSDSNATAYPSTEKQKVLLQALADELKAMGLDDARMDEWGYVTATLPGNSGKRVPAIALIGHADTSDQVSGANVKPIVHRDYRGGDIVLPNGLVIAAADNPDLKGMIGFDIITGSGDTLLGADDKAGVAEIFDAIHYLVTHPGVKHGTVKVLVTPDEETGRGTEKLDAASLKADFGYTVDAGERGEIEAETFSADAMTFRFYGRSTHPGYAKGKMINSVRVAADFLGHLPKDRLSPETTDGRDGYVHCLAVTGNEELTTVKFIIRDFETPKLEVYEDMLKKLAADAVGRHPGSRMEYDLIQQYRNMKEVLDAHPQVEAYAIEAMKRLGITPKPGYIRGGTDGARLCYMGLPTPNIFDGAHNYHSPFERVAVQDMEMAVKTIVEILKVWEERSS